MQNSKWVDLKELAKILEIKSETLRRGCVSNKYICRFIKTGKFKHYEIEISSLPPNYQKKYNNKTQTAKIKDLNSQDYNNAPAWAKKQADKYLELIAVTDGMTHSQIIDFLKIWNREHPEKAACYTSIYNARVKYEKSGVAGLLSQKGNRNNRSIIPEDYFEYYKSLYLREGAPSAFFC